jgi:predicted oxidoreductase
MVVVGAGLAGLSAALEAARQGATVSVVDKASVFGGHAVMSEADVTIIDTPLQVANGVHDSPELAFDDFMKWGEDSNQEWVRYYVTHSRSEIYDWLIPMGVAFDGLGAYPGNSVRRAHNTHGRGLGLVTPVYRECLKNPNISFEWNTEVLELLKEHSRIVGLRAKSLRSGEVRDVHARAVILATGGFQSNLGLVRKYWPRDLAVPVRLLAGSGVNSTGSGLELASKAGAALTRLDHQWNYDRGLPDPRYPGANRGLNASVNGDRVNTQGQLFLPADASSKAGLRTTLNQPGATYWSIFDEHAKRSFWISGSDWGNFDTIQRVILDNDAIVKKAATIDELAAKTGLPAEALKAAIAHGNAGSPKVDSPPFYAAQFFPLTRKSMGGIAIDLSARALDKRGKPIAGLYAAGEVTGEAGINGKAALEGTFLGPAIVTGRGAARAAVKDLGLAPLPAIVPPRGAVEPRQPMAAAIGVTSSGQCESCHDLPLLTAKTRVGYWHFERAHQVVLERKFECAQCHGEIGMPNDAVPHRINRLAQTNTCTTCHVAN